MDIMKNSCRNLFFCIVFTAALFAPLLWCACTAKATQSESARAGENATAGAYTEVPNGVSAPAKKVAVFFGHGFNDKELVADTLEYLNGCYGLESENDVIFPLVYPDDFKSGTRTRISLLDDKLLELHVSGVVLLGAPEDTNSALAVLRDSGWLYPVYSFFPQDDVLGIEYVSDFVLENEDLSFQLDAESVFRLLRNTIDAIENQTAAAKNQKDTQLKETVQSLIGKKWTVRFYTDSETGIRSANHFLIKDTTPPPVGTLR